MLKKKEEENSRILQLKEELDKYTATVSYLQQEIEKNKQYINVYEFECDRLRGIALENYQQENKISQLLKLLSDSDDNLAKLENNIFQEKEEHKQTKEELRKTKEDLEKILEKLSETEGNLLITREELLNSTEQLSSMRETLVEEKARTSDLQHRLGQVMSYAEGYYPCRWATGLIPFWRKYFYENFKTIEEKIKILKNNLDKKSCDTIDLICERNFILLPDSKNQGKFLYKYEELYTDEEKEGLNNPFNKEEYLKKFIVDPDNYFETTVAKFHNGLICLPEGISKQIKGKEIIDGGSYWGDSALVFLEYEPSKIHCFEPSSVNYKKILKLVNDNELCDFVIINKKGLSKIDETATLVSFGIDSSQSILGYNVVPDTTNGVPTDTEEVSLTSIDEYVISNNTEVGLIKLDIEGYEYSAMTGALETIKKYKPILLISIYHMPKDFFEIKPMLEKLNLGYKFMVRKTTYRDLIAEVMLIGYVDKIAIDLGE